MAIHWQVKFRSLRTNTLYTANVYDDGYTGTPIQLTGAANPFETQEDDDDDLFVPVRTQSGYLRIVDTGMDNNGNPFNWRDIIPTTDTDRPVTLTDELGTVQWQGFMQAQNFGFALYEKPEEKSLPLQCSLTVLSRHNNTYYKQDSCQNFAYLLKTILDSIPGTCRPTTMVIQGGADAQTWLLKMIDWQLFFEENTEWEPTRLNTGFEGEPQPRYSLLECLVNMCRFWGWTARTDQQTLYLTCVDDTTVTGWLTLTYTQLTTMAGGTAEGTISTGGYIPAGFGTDIYASTDNQDFQLRGPSKAVVTANAEAPDSAIIKSWPDGVAGRMVLQGWDTSIIIGPYYTYDLTGYSFETSLIKATGTANSTFNMMNIPVSGTRTTDETLPVIRVKTAYNGTTFASFETKKAHCFTDGYLQIKGKAYKNNSIIDSKDQYTPEIGTKFMVMRIGIGMTRATAKWFRGYADYGGYGYWSFLETTCRGRLGGSGDTIWVSPYIDVSGNKFNKIQTDGNTYNQTYPMYGKVFIDILGSEDSDLSSFTIADFAIEFNRTESTSIWNPKERTDSKEYKAVNANNIQDSWSDDCIFCSENRMKFGFGVVMNPDYTYFAGYGYGGSQEITKPEQHLADRVVNYWATSKRKQECDMLSADIIKLTPKVKGEIDGTTVWPMSISRNWREDVVKVKFIEV